MSQQGLRQASVRAESGTTLTYEGDWHALWDGMDIEEGTFNERMLLYCSEKLGVTYTNINDAMQALAIDQGATNFGSMGTFDASVGPAYETESETLFAAMSPAPDATRQGHINTLIAALKTAGVWTKMDVLYVFAAHDAQGARLNWKVPASFAASEVNSPTFTVDRGYAGNGTTSYINSNFNMQTDGVTFTHASAHMAGWSRTSAADNAPQLGNVNLACQFYFRYGGDTTYARINNTGGAIGGTTDGSGLFAADCPAIDGSFIGYRNGSAFGSGTGSPVAGVASANFFIDYVTYYSIYQMASASAGGHLTAGEHAAYYTAMAAYMTAVGAA